MQEVIQGNDITLEALFYDIALAEGGVPTDPDGYLHTWDIQNDVNSRVSRIVLLEAGAFPTSATKYYYSIIDSGSDFEVKGYDDAGRTNEIVSTGSLPYGIYTNQAMAEVGGSGYTGTISVTFPGIGGGVENFEIEDIGATEPTYEIIGQNNNQVVAPTIFPTRLSMGHYSVVYAVAIDAPPGENWRLVARGMINGVDTYYNNYFKVIDAAIAEDEIGKLVTLTELKAAIEKQSNEDDALLDSYILAASKAVEDYCAQFFHEESQTVVFDGNGYERLYFEGDGPVSSITKLEYRNMGNHLWISINLKNVAFEGFFLNRLDGSNFYDGNSNWRIEYIAGIAQAPAQVRRGVIELVRFWYDSRNRAGIKADVIGGGLRTIYNESTDILPDNVVQILKPFRRLT